MTHRYLLDTNAVSDLVRAPQGRGAARIAETGEAAVATSVIVAAELRFGAAKKGAARLIAQVEAIIGAMTVLPVEPPVDRTYAQVRAGLEATGRPIGANDLLIAAHALTLDLILVTGNTREFRHVKGLRIENWVR